MSLRFARIWNWLAFALVVAMAILAVQHSLRKQLSDEALRQRMSQIFIPQEAQLIPCPSGVPPPIRLLVLGQSNAANHGAELPIADEKTIFFYEGRCYRTSGPAPGATGTGGNIWEVLAPTLRRATGRPIIIAVLAVDATTIAEWTEQGPLRTHFSETLVEFGRQGFKPDLILWQHGEADTRANTLAADYVRGLEELRSLLFAHGVKSPMVLALSTRCRSYAGTAIRDAVREFSGRNQGVFLGPDTDSLTGIYRSDGCHLSASGLIAAASLWSETILALRQDFLPQVLDESRGERSFKDER